MDKKENYYCEYCFKEDLDKYIQLLPIGTIFCSHKCKDEYQDELKKIKKTE